MKRGLMSYVGPVRNLNAALKHQRTLMEASSRITAGIKPLLGPDSLTLYISGLREVGRAFMASRDRAMHLASMAALVLDGKVSVEPTKGRAWLVRIEPEP